MIDLQEILALELPKNDAGAATVRDYLKSLLLLVWVDGEGFDGKRPFGNSGWGYELTGPVAERYSVSRGDAEWLIEQAIGVL